MCMCLQLHHSLQQRAQKRTGQVLNMEEISTRLAGLRSTVIAMPGLQADSIGPVSLLDMHLLYIGIYNLHRTVAGISSAECFVSLVFPR